MLKFGDTYLNFGGIYLEDYKVPVYNVILQQSVGGTINASPLSGHRNTEVTLSNTPTGDYLFGGYKISGSNLYDNNKFKFEESDVIASAKFYINPNPLNLPPYTIRVRCQDGITPTFSKGTSVRVSQNPNVWDITYNNSNWYRLLYYSGGNGIIEVLGANASGVEKMNYLFNDCSLLSSVNLFDTSTVTDMSNMFIRCINLKTVPLFDTSNVTSMSAMFDYDSKITAIPNLDTNKVTDMRYMLAGCKSLTSVPLFDTSNVTNMESMLQECKSLTSIPFFNTSNVTSMSYMLSYCSALKSIPLFDTSNVRDMNGMFYNCKSLTSVPSFNTNNLISARYTFGNCSALKSIPLFDTSNVDTMEGMCYCCSSLTSIPLFNTNKVTNMIAAFRGCGNVKSGALALYQQASTQATPLHYHSSTFRDCGINTQTGSAELAQIPSDWK